MYDSTSIVQIFQDNPFDWKPSSFRLKGWRETVAGYLYEADKLSRCLWINRRLMKQDNYPWAVTINIRKVLSPNDINEVWKQVCRKLRARGVVALWVREPSKKNHCNYHLIVKSQLTQAALKRAIDESMPDRATVSYHKQVKPIKSQWHWCRYITKAKTTGYINGKKVEDKYENKRMLFVPKIGLPKYYNIGKFWEKPKKEIWQDIINKEKRIVEGLEKTNIRKLVNHVYEWLDRYVPLTEIERSFGYWADSPAIRDWANNLFGDETDGQLLADNGNYEDDQNEDEIKLDRPMRRRSRRWGFAKVFTPIGACIARFCDRLKQWCSRVPKPRPDPLSLHPP
jgi:hypothetical protein